MIKNFQLLRARPQPGLQLLLWQPGAQRERPRPEDALPAQRVRRLGRLPVGDGEGRAVLAVPQRGCWSQPGENMSTSAFLINIYIHHFQDDIFTIRPQTLLAMVVTTALVGLTMAFCLGVEEKFRRNAEDREEGSTKGNSRDGQKRLAMERTVFKMFEPLVQVLVPTSERRSHVGGFKSGFSGKHCF